MNDRFNTLIFYKEILLEKFFPARLYSCFLKNQKPIILLRVDDFPHWKKSFDEFKEFDAVVKRYEIPYLLGVTPFLAKNPLDVKNKEFRPLSKEELSFLRTAQDQGRIKVGLHGVTHQASKKKPFTEFGDKPLSKVEEEIKRGRDFLRSHGIKTDVYIPPFNSFSKKHLALFMENFEMVTGGPESIIGLGKKKKLKKNGAYYLPTYFPYYYHPKMKIPLMKGNIILTIHWNWFDPKKPEKLENLLKKIKPFCVSYDEFIKNIK